MNLPTLALRNIFRNKVRLALTMAGVAVALLTFVTLRTAVTSWDEAKEYAVKDRLVTRHKVTFIMPLPIKYATDVRDIKAPDGQPLLKASTYLNWFGGKLPGRDDLFFATIAMEPESFLTVYDEIVIDEAAKTRLLATRNAAIVGDLLAAQLGWKPGDKVTLESPIFGPRSNGEPWTFEIAGLYTTSSKAVDRQTLYFRWDYLNDGASAAMKDTAGWIASRSADPSRTLEVAAGIDRMFDDRDTQTTTQDEKSFFQSFMGMVSSVLEIMSVLSYIILLILGLILANAIGMNVRERTNEFAAMKAIGFRGGTLARLILAESTLVAVLGALPGVLLSWVIVDLILGDFLEYNLAMFFPVFRVQGGTYALAVVAAAVIGLLAGIVPAINAARLNVIENLRRVA
jgi:putative ABC transport system permease protein